MFYLHFILKMYVTILNKILKLNFILNIITYIKKLETLKLNLKI